MNQSKTSITRLHSGGLITNYFCTSRCRHCLYACSPGRDKKYITEEVLDMNIKKVKDLGCTSLHIGGGEPFLNIPELEKVIMILTSKGVHIEYVETNSSWFKDRESACRILEGLRNKGLSTLLISISPFHNEHIPLSKVNGVIDACRKTGMNIFPWIQDFYAEINAFDPGVTHSLIEYTEKYGNDYIKNIPLRYWVTFRGRALKTYAPYMNPCSLDSILSMNKGGCKELFDTHHFHVDFYGNYLPGLCPGLSIECTDLGKPLDKKKYPVLTTLMSSGVNGLFTFAEKEYTFVPGRRYVSKCDLCTDIRDFMVKQHKKDVPELQPAEFYEYV